MNLLADGNLTLGIAKIDLATARGCLTLAAGPTEYGNARSGLTQATEGPMAHAIGENAFARRSVRSGFQSDWPVHFAALRRVHVSERLFQSGRRSARPLLS